jgi:hypothetical protein
MENANWLRFAYAANIIILVPIVATMASSNGVARVFEGRVDDSTGLRLLVGSLWFAILLGSVAGLRWPDFFAPLILVQIVYKSTWLALFVLPLVANGRSGDVPWGISVTFMAIVLIYPLLFWKAL